jgi:hypothetical protein
MSGATGSGIAFSPSTSQFSVPALETVQHSNRFSTDYKAHNMEHNSLLYILEWSQAKNLSRHYA